MCTELAGAQVGGEGLPAGPGSRTAGRRWQESGKPQEWSRGPSPCPQNLCARMRLTYAGGGGNFLTSGVPTQGMCQGVRKSLRVLPGALFPLPWPGGADGGRGGREGGRGQAGEEPLQIINGDAVEGNAKGH